MLWLARELTTNEAWQSRMIVIVSHDRVFLDETTTDTLHVSGAARKLTQSRGNYSSWAKRREQQQLTHGREMESKQREIKELRDFNPATLGSTPKAMKARARSPHLESGGTNGLGWDGRPTRWAWWGMACTHAGLSGVSCVRVCVCVLVRLAWAWAPDRQDETEAGRQVRRGDEGAQGAGAHLTTSHHISPHLATSRHISTHSP